MLKKYKTQADKQPKNRVRVTKNTGKLRLHGNIRVTTHSRSNLDDDKWGNRTKCKTQELTNKVKQDMNNNN